MQKKRALTMNGRLVRSVVGLLAIFLTACDGSASSGNTGALPTRVPPSGWNVTGQLATVSNTIAGLGALKGEISAYGVEADGAALWVYSGDTGDLVRIDPPSNKVIATIPNQIGTSDVSYGASSAWSCNRGDSKGLMRLNSQTNQAETQIDVSMYMGFSCAAVVALTRAIWTVELILGDGSSVHLERLDPATKTTTATILVPDTDAYHFAAVEAGVWVWGPDEGLLRIDPHTNQIVGSLPMQGGAAVALGAGSIWCANATDGSQLRITPAP
jgi:hypothetical protein